MFSGSVKTIVPACRIGFQATITFEKFAPAARSDGSVESFSLFSDLFSGQHPTRVITKK
jgi:hypothetical protein